MTLVKLLGLVLEEIFIISSLSDYPDSFSY